MDFSKLSLHQAKRLEVESQVNDLFVLGKCIKVSIISYNTFFI